MFHPDMRPKPKRWDGRTLTNVGLEHKFDGWRATLVVTPEREVMLVGRSFNLLHDMSEAAQEWLYSIAHKVPTASVLDCELVAPGRPASELVNEFKSNSPELELRPFAVPRWNGTSYREADFKATDIRIKKVGLEPPPRMMMDVLDETNREALDWMIRNAGVEGFVIKRRPWNVQWWKIKRVDTIDLVVRATKPGKGKHSGRLGALECSYSDSLEIVASVGKGCDDKWRDLEPGEVVGRVVEISHEGFQRSRYKFSSFIRWRDDKRPSDCHEADQTS